MYIRIHQILRQTKIAGPGLRFCIWVQGCSRHCKGCMASETWPFDGGTLMEINDVFEQAAATANIEGITFLGGEPFEQAAAVYKLASRLKALGLSITVFTGYTYEHLLMANDKNYKKLLEIVDLLIDGPFEIEQYDLSRPWVGSSNQQYHFLTDRYSESNLINVENKIEVRISHDGKALFNGMGDFDKIKKFI